MPNPIDLRLLAGVMRTTQDEGRQIEPLTSRLPAFDLASAYEVAHLIHEARIGEGARPVGRKIGFSNAAMWSSYGVHEPIWAYIYDTTVVRLPGPHTTCRIGRFAEPKIEPEIVLHFRSSPPPDGDLPAILDCVDWVAHGFEIVQSHFPGWRFRAADTVADGGLHGTLLVGPPQPAERLGTGLPADLQRFSVGLFCDGTLRETGRGENVLGSPLAAVAHLNAVLAMQPRSPTLRADEMVTTGTITTAHRIHAGETWRSELESIALPGLSVEFVA